MNDPRNDSHHTHLCWPRRFRPVLSGEIKTMPADFQVTELSAFKPAGRGEHLWLWVEKQQTNTEWAARQLARACDVSNRQVGYAGLKDRQAITRQWFSIQKPQTLDPADINAALPEQIRVLHCARHDRKLRTGYLLGNRFLVTLRYVTGDRHAADSTLEKIAAAGFPNYFGAQRFGRHGNNLRRAEQMFHNNKTPRQAHQRGLLLSAARAYVFNNVLAKRLRDMRWETPMPGDVALLNGSRSRFVIEAGDIHTAGNRLHAGDIHLTGPLWGRGGTPCRDIAADWEEKALAPYAHWLRGLEKAGLKQDRRALRCLPERLCWQWHDGDTHQRLTLQFDLPKGSYATELLAELGRFTRPENKPESI